MTYKNTRTNNNYNNNVNIDNTQQCVSIQKTYGGDFPNDTKIYHEELPIPAI